MARKTTKKATKKTTAKKPKTMEAAIMAKVDKAMEEAGRGGRPRGGRGRGQ